MMPIGPLMIEHRLIERMVALLEAHLRQVESNGRADLNLLDAAVDFFRTYADRTHHGKEEDILFAALADKDLTDEHQGVMDELIEEHKRARTFVGRLRDAEQRQAVGGSDTDPDIAPCLHELVALYPSHIEKEDKRFFRPCMEYFSDAEQQEMLDQFVQFDKRMIHEKYRATVEGFESA